MTWQFVKGLILVLISAMTLSACDDIDRLPGTRLAVFAADQSLLMQGQTQPVQLMAPTTNRNWLMPGNVPTHASYHLALGAAPVRQWGIDIGIHENARQKITAQPIVVDGLVYAMDAAMNVSARQLADGELVWRVNVSDPNEASQTFGGGLAFGNGRIFAATGDGELYALAPNTGRAVWRTKIAGPARGGPTFDNGRLYVQTLNNRTQAFLATTGQILWTHSGLEEQTSIVGTSSPAAQGDFVYITYSSGQVFALLAADGREAWSDILTSLSPSSGRLQLEIADIQALPVLDRGSLYVTSNGGRTVAYDSATGRRLWQYSGGGTQTPAVGQSHLFLVTNDGTALSLDRTTGQPAWIKDLGTNATQNGTRKIEWFGPILAGNRLLLANSRGQLITLSPYNGRLLGEVEVGAGVAVPPIVAQGSLLLLTQRADLLAYR